MPVDPVVEHDRVRESYSPMRTRDAAVYVLVVAVLATVSLVRQVDWFVFAGMLTAVAAWELTKLRLRRNARRFVASAR